MATEGNTFNISLSGLRKILSGLIVNSTPSGLRVQGKITEVLIDDASWTPLPATPLTGRNSIRIQNIGGFEMKLNYVSGSSGGYVGMVLINNGENYYNITDNIQLYGRLAPGSGSATINVEEIA